MNSMSKFVCAALAATAIVPATALAQMARNQGYLTDTKGDIVMTVTGLCVHTSEWTPAHAVEGCDGYVRPVAATPPAAARPPAPPPAPAPIVAQAPPPKPIPKPAPAPAPQRFSFSADALFAFDKADLKPEGKAMLDDLARNLSTANYDVVLVTGHTDRFGSTAYNQKLSERRATSVKNYLVSKNVPANRITTAGMGESQPMTKPGDCRGPKSPKVIACLQPDRRVDVDINVPASNR
jgi:OOP family OmpA-OmpF porin